MLNSRVVSEHQYGYHVASEGDMERPTFLQAFTQRVLVNAEFIGPVGQALRAPLERKPSVVSSVSILLAASRPRAVRRFVMTVVVVAFNGVLRRWPWTEVVVERLERMQPAVAHADTAAAVVMKLGVVRVVTTGLDRLPVATFRAFRQPVGCHAISGDLTGEMAT